MTSNFQLHLARDQFGRLVWTHKVHEKEREIWTCRLAATKWTNVLLTAATAIAALLAAYTRCHSLDIATAILGAIATAFLIYQISFDPAQRESEHMHAAKRLLGLRERYLLLIQRIHDRAGDKDALQTELEALSRETATVYEFAPATSKAAYAAASKALKVEGEFTCTPEEIDSFLPEALRNKE